MAECLFNDLLKRLYFENSFMKGNLWINGRRANPFGLSVPIFSIVEARSCVVPSQSMLPFHDTVRSTSKRVLWYRGDTGVALQHIGILVGRTAIDQIWPDAIDWIKDVWKSCGSAAEARS